MDSNDMIYSTRYDFNKSCIILNNNEFEIYAHPNELLHEHSYKTWIIFKELLDEKLGYETPISYEDWIEKNHYQQIPQPETKWLYRQEQGYIESMKNITLKELAKQRIDEFKSALKKYMI